MKKAYIITILTILSIIIIGCSQTNTSTPTSQATGKTVTIFKSPNCGCCEGYAAEMRKQGFDVEVKPTPDMNKIKQEYNIPRHMESCHTTMIGNYFVEGHVPISAVNKLLEEKPDIDGITLPNMPSGTPGMPGRKTETWKISALKDGQATSFMDV